MTRCHCAVDGCLSTSYDANPMKFFRLPKDPVRAMSWMKLIGRPDAKQFSNFFVCEEHFSDDCFIPLSNKRLTKDALPCVNLPPPTVDSTIMVHKSTQYQPSQDFAKKPTKKREAVKNQKAIFNELVDKYLGEDIGQIVKAQADLRLKFADNKLENDFKTFCLKFYYTSPASYLGLQTYLNLPDRETLTRLLMISMTNDNKKLFKTLKAKVDCMSDLEKNCSILIGYVDLKPHLFYHIKEDRIYGFSESEGVQTSVPSDSAIVFFVRGIYEPWVLAVDYALFSKSIYHPANHTLKISSWIHKTIRGLLCIGLNIRVCITNLSHDIIVSTARNLNAPLVERPFFVVENKQIYYTLDPTYSVKKIYSCFMEYEFHFHVEVAKWQDVVDFYNRDSKKKLRLAPKLSEVHVKCSNGDELPYDLIINIFSETVAAGISAYVEFGAMDSSASGTVNFLSIMSKLIDFTHSCNTPHHRNLKRPFDGSEEQIKFIVDALTYFRHLRLYKNNVDVTDSVEVITDFQITIKSLLMLSEDFKLENYPNLFTRNINFNVMLNFFRSVSKKSKSGNLLPWRMVREFRSMFFRNMLKTPKYRYCPELLNGVFYEYLNNAPVVNQDMRPIAIQKPFKASTLSLIVFRSDYKDLKLPCTDQMKAIGVFVLNKCLKMHVNCNLPNYHKKILDKTDEDFHVERYPQYRYEPVMKTIIPDEYFMSFLWQLENELMNYLNGDFLNAFFIMKLEHRSESTSDSFRPPCNCFPTYYLKKLFFRIRLSQILKLNNKTFGKSPLLTFGYKSLN